MDRHDNAISAGSGPMKEGTEGIGGDVSDMAVCSGCCVCQEYHTRYGEQGSENGPMRRSPVLPAVSLERRHAFPLMPTPHYNGNEQEDSLHRGPISDP